MSSYKVSEPSALKFLKANGAVVDENGNVVNDATDYWKKVYDQAEPKVAKYLHADGTIDENPGSGGGGSDLEDNKEVSITENGTIEITPTEGKDGMKKVTATVNVSVSPSIEQGPSWATEESFKMNIIPNGVKCVIWKPWNSPHIIIGNGVDTIKKLIFDIEGALPSDVVPIATYGNSVVMAYNVMM